MLLISKLIESIFGQFTITVFL